MIVRTWIDGVHETDMHEVIYGCHSQASVYGHVHVHSTARSAGLRAKEETSGWLDVTSNLNDLRMHLYYVVVGVY